MKYPNSSTNTYYEKFKTYSKFIDYNSFEFSTKAKLVDDIRVECFKSSVSRNVRGNDELTYLKKVYEALAPQEMFNLYSYHAFLYGLHIMGYLDMTEHDFEPKPDLDIFQTLRYNNFAGIGINEKYKESVKEMINEIDTHRTKYMPKTKMDISPDGQYTPKFIQQYWDKKKKPSKYDKEQRKKKMKERLL